MQIRHGGSTAVEEAPVTFYLSILPLPSVLSGSAPAKLAGMASTIVRHSTQAITSRRQVVDRAEALLRARVGEAVSIAQLCRVAGVSERSLRNAFYDVRGMSPKRWAVRARLAEVRRALSDANGTRGAVTTIATDYGFFELGRFASTYKAVFGETPSATLRGHGGSDARAAS